MPAGTLVRHASKAPVEAMVGYLHKPASGRVVVDYSGKGRSNIQIENHAVGIRDLRDVADQLCLDRDGFQLTTHNSALVHTISKDSSFDGDALAAVAAAYHAPIIGVIKARTGARDVIPLRNGLVMRRQKAIKREEERYEEVRVASGYTHLDFTPRSAKDYILIGMAWEGIQEISPYQRFAIIQTWHVLTPPPQDFALTFCDRSTVSAEDLFVIDYFPPKHRVDIMAEVQAVAHNRAHQWYYLSNMSVDELILFKGYDSDAERAQPMPHTAFRDPKAPPGTPPRASIEGRYLTFFD